MPNGPKTLRNLRLKPGAALMKAELNARRRPRVVNVRNLFPGVNPPPQPPVYPVTPTLRVSPQSMFPGPKEPSAFNMNARIVRLRKRQENAVKAAEGQEALAFPMNDSQGGDTVGGRRTRKRNMSRLRKTLRLRK